MGNLDGEAHFASNVIIFLETLVHSRPIKDCYTLSPYLMPARSVSQYHDSNEASSSPFLSLRPRRIQYDD